MFTTENNYPFFYELNSWTITKTSETMSQSASVLNHFWLSLSEGKYFQR